MLRCASLRLRLTSEDRRYTRVQTNNRPLRVLQNRFLDYCVIGQIVVVGGVYTGKEEMFSLEKTLEGFREQLANSYTASQLAA